jgi:hypothetical protein
MGSSRPRFGGVLDPVGAHEPRGAEEDYLACLGKPFGILCPRHPGEQIINCVYYFVIS